MLLKHLGRCLGPGGKTQKEKTFEQGLRGEGKQRYWQNQHAQGEGKRSRDIKLENVLLQRGTRGEKSGTWGRLEW